MREITQRKIIKLGEIFEKNSLIDSGYRKQSEWFRVTISEFWDDLERALDSRENHFLGEIVLTPADSNKTDIISGINRLALAFITLCVLIEKSGDKELKNKYILDTKGEFKFQSNPQDREFLTSLLKAVEKEGVEINLERFWDCVREEEDSWFSDENAPIIANYTNGKYSLLHMLDNALESAKKLESSRLNAYINALLNMEVLCFFAPNIGAAFSAYHNAQRNHPPLILDQMCAHLIHYLYTLCGDKDGILAKEINNLFAQTQLISTKIYEHKNAFMLKYNIPDLYSLKTYRDSWENVLLRAQMGFFRFKSDKKGWRSQKCGLTMGDNYDMFECFDSEILSHLDYYKKAGDVENIKKFILSYSTNLRDFFETFLVLLNECETNVDVFKLLVLENLSVHFYGVLVEARMRNELDSELATLLAKLDIVTYKCKPERPHIPPHFERDLADLKRYTEFKIWDNGINEVIHKIIYRAADYSFFRYLFFERHCPNASIETLKALNKKSRGATHGYILGIDLTYWMPEYRQELKKRGFKSVNDFLLLMPTFGNQIAMEPQFLDDWRSCSVIAENYKKSSIEFVRNFDIEGFNKAAIIKENKEAQKWLEKFFWTFRYLDK